MCLELDAVYQRAYRKKRSEEEGHFKVYLPSLEEALRSYLPNDEIHLYPGVYELDFKFKLYASVTIKGVPDNIDKEFNSKTREIASKACGRNNCKVEIDNDDISNITSEYIEEDNSTPGDLELTEEARRLGIVPCGGATHKQTAHSEPKNVTKEKKGCNPNYVSNWRVMIINKATSDQFLWCIGKDTIVSIQNVFLKAYGGS
ncbi:hypothetical protein RFI_12886 [Reticulomyxa filosa]|uniref:Uncharacterized protein n=1 Tax=Reticulomyxa filosa TaxID=46433 RepID=X6ND60_RETFI|nr:hypothetical protein RFI_12886 [Reticulomyxa filosa]|eukprot:ETO24270.1 hypothetical protein RFI_12886 [Reticulomyxa filosa]